MSLQACKFLHAQYHQRNDEFRDYMPLLYSRQIQVSSLMDTAQNLNKATRLAAVSEWNANEERRALERWVAV